MSDLDTIRARARQHERELDMATRFLRVKHLAERWDISESSVRAIPFADLPYAEHGRGAKHKHRRYDPADVLAYEALLKARAAA